MARVSKIDSNVTGLRYAVESDTPKVLPGSPVWWPLEPNSYNDFGGNVTTVARSPISSDRQKKKGVVTDLDAQGGFSTDITYTNTQDLMQGFFFADFRKKPEVGGYGLDLFTSVANADSSYNAASGLNVLAQGSLIFTTGFTNPGNNGLKRVATSAAGKITVDETLVDEANPPSGAKIVTVGVEASAGDLDVVVTGGALPKITSTTLDLTTLGLIAGEWIFVGGDVAGDKFTTAANNGWKRVKSISANEIVIDKSTDTMVSEANTTSTVRIFFGRVLINEVGTLIKRRTYHLERTLGAPDNAQPTQVQAEYLKGATPNELIINFATADKLTAELSFVAMEHELVDAVTGPKAGARPALTEADGFNTSSDVSRIKMAIVDDATATPTAMFAYVTEATLTIGNNVTPNKVIGVAGAADMTAGNFDVSGSLTAYFVDVAALNALKNNASVTIDFVLVKANAGIVIDIPLMSLGEGRANVEADQPITLPISFDAAKNPYGYTVFTSFFDYLPTAADL